VPQDYVHRIGRTARAGAAGIAIAFCSDEERGYLSDIEKLTRRSVPVIPTRRRRVAAGRSAGSRSRGKATGLHNLTLDLRHALNAAWFASGFP
jgi:ATP-dependent RNA helicase RhlE